MADSQHNPDQSGAAKAAAVLPQVWRKLAEAMAILEQVCPEPPGMGHDDGTSSAPAHAADERAGDPAGPGRGGSRTPARVPVPSQRDMEAFNLSVLLGRKQADIAETLNGQHGTTYSQGQVSRMIRRARRYIEATGLPIPTGPKGGAAKSVDPHVLDLGRRTDGRPTDGRRSKRRRDED